MNPSQMPSTRKTFKDSPLNGPLAKSAFLALCVCTSQFALGQSVAPTNYDPAYLQQILKRLDAQEAEIKSLKSELSRKTNDTTVQSEIKSLKSELSSKINNAPAVEAMSKPETFPKISFHGFGNVDFSYKNAARNTSKRSSSNTFTLGQLDLFATSQLTDNMSILSEIVLEGDSANKMSIDLERLLFQWRPSDYFNADIGRFHTSVGYYNTAYHHGAWFQTAIGRPTILDFEDGGGIIPSHMVGLHMHGEIPSGKLGLGYILEVGNGRAYKESDPGTVQNKTDSDQYKAVNLAFVARPDGVPGLQIGAGLYHDTISAIPDTKLLAVKRTEEFMLHAHAVYKSGPWEYLSEGYLVNHKTAGDAEHNTPAGFVQLAHKFNTLTPFTRFSYVNAVSGDRLWPFVGADGLHYGPGVGVRWDFCNLAALKLQYDFMYNHTSPNPSLYTPGNVPAAIKGWDSTVTLQVAFTF